MQAYRKFGKACELAGVGPYRFHDLRPTFNTNMRRAGGDQIAIMKITGHKTLNMLIRYSHVDGDEGKAAMAKPSSHLARDVDTLEARDDG